MHLPRLSPSLLLLLIGSCIFVTEQAYAVQGGSPVSASDPIAKSVVAVFFPDYDPTGGCTGIIIAEDIILTAAHCIKENTRFELGFGLNMSQEMGLHVPIQAYSVPMDWCYNGNYKTLTHRNDIALLYFKGGLPKGFQPITLLNDPDGLQTRSPIRITGYGPSGAGAALTEFATELQNAQYSKYEIEIAGSQHQHPVGGDSGGPAFVLVNGTPYLAGVDSMDATDLNHSINDHSHDYSELYSRVSGYSGWISEESSRLRKEGTSRGPGWSCNTQSAPDCSSTAASSPRTSVQPLIPAYQRLKKDESLP
jgi:secreted trypsin-like serine protease